MPTSEGTFDGDGGAGEGEPRGSVVPRGFDTAGDSVRIVDRPARRSERESPQRNEPESPSVRNAVMPRSRTAALAKASLRFGSLASAPLGADP
jgi:hypothetical protein